MSVHEYTFNLHCNDIIEYYYNVNPLLCVCAFGIGAKKLEHSVGERDRRDGKSEEQNFSGMVKGNREKLC